jgi:hypothetical protein
MVRETLAVALAALLGASLFACADREQLRAQRVAQQASAEAEDDAACRAKGEAGTPAYDECREALAAGRAENAAIQEQKARDFDRVLGAGTSGLSDNY